MLTPKDAYEALLTRNRLGMGNPTQPCGPPLRWYFDAASGELSACAWRSLCPSRYPDYTRPAGFPAP